MPNPRKYKHNMGLKFIMSFALYCVFCLSCFGGDFFSIKDVKIIKDKNSDGIFVAKKLGGMLKKYYFLALTLFLREDINFNKI